MDIKKLILPTIKISEYEEKRIHIYRKHEIEFMIY